MVPVVVGVVLLVAVGVLWGVGDLVDPRGGPVAVPEAPDAQRGADGSDAGGTSEPILSCVVDDRPLSPADACIAWELRADAEDGFLGYGVARGIVVTTEPHVVRGLALSNGRERWRWTSFSRLCGPPLVVGDRVVVAREDGAVWALERVPVDRRAVTRWSHQLPAAGCHALVAAGELVVAVGPSGAMAVDPATGEPSWSIGDAIDPVAPAVTAGDHVVVAEQDRVSAFAARTGATAWTVPVAGVRQLAAHREAAVVVGADEVLLLDAATGRPRWVLHQPGADAVGVTPTDVVVGRATHLLLVDADTGTPRSVVPVAGLVEAVAGGGAREPAQDLYALTSVGLQRVTPALRGETWTVRVRRPMLAPVTDGGRGDRLPLLARTGARLLVLVPPPPPARPVTEPHCGAVLPSEALGGLDGFREGEVHAAVSLDAEGVGELWVGSTRPGARPSSLTVSAVHRDTGVAATLSEHGPGDTTSVTVAGGGRSATGWPMHWAFTAGFPEPGCWEVRVTGDGLDARVLVPVGG